MTDHTVLAPPRISKLRFTAALERAGSPALPAADACYDALAAYGVDPAVALGFFIHESAAGTRGRAAGRSGFPATNSWGNLRWHDFYASLPYPVSDIDGFVGYAGFPAAADHFARHLVGQDGTDNYLGRFGPLMTVSQVVPVYAPAADANTPADYVAAVNATVDELTGGNPMPRVLLVAGHNSIEAITQDGLADGLDKAATVARLRTSTGAHGEREWTGSFVQLATGALRAAGVDAQFTDAIYHPDVYAADWDLILICHYHRDAAVERAMFATIDPVLVPAEMTVAARAEAARFVDRVIGGYAAATGIPVTEPLVTLNMTRIYGYGYATAGSPALVLEFGNADQDADVLYEPGIARIVRFIRDAVLEHLNLAPVAAPPPQRRATDVPPPAPPTQLALTPTKAAASQLRAIADTLERL